MQPTERVSQSCQDQTKDWDAHIKILVTAKETPECSSRDLCKNEDILELPDQIKCVAEITFKHITQNTFQTLISL